MAHRSALGETGAAVRAGVRAAWRARGGSKKAALEATAFFEGGGHEAGPQLFWLLIDVVGKEQVL